MGLADRLQTLSEDELRVVFEQRSTNVVFRLLNLVTGTLLAMVRGALLLMRNWRLILLELVPAVWLAVVLWDLRYHVVAGHSLVVPTGWWALGAAGVIFGATATSYWCNVAFAFAAVDDHNDVKAAARLATGHLSRIVATAAAISLLHAWVSLRGAVISVGAFGLGLAAVTALNMYLYTALPVAIVGLGRRRLSWRGRIERSVVAGTVSVVAAAPGFVASRLGQVLLAFSATRPVGVIVLGLAVALQVAGVSSSRAVAMSSELLRQPEEVGDARA